MSCFVTPPVLVQFFTSPLTLGVDCLHTMLLPAFSVEPARYPLLFGTTLLIEVPLYVAALLLLRAAGFWRALLVAILVNVATHPFVSFALPGLLEAANQSRFATHLAVGEVFAPIVEGLLLWRLTRLRFPGAMGLAVACNLISWTLGAVLLSA